jgi:hypothetical protein
VPEAFRRPFRPVLEAFRRPFRPVPEAFRRPFRPVLEAFRLLPGQPQVVLVLLAVLCFHFLAYPYNLYTYQRLIFLAFVFLQSKLDVGLIYLF